MAESGPLRLKLLKSYSDSYEERGGCFETVSKKKKKVGLVKVGLESQALAVCARTTLP